MLHVEKVHCCSNYMGIDNKAKEVLCSTEVFLDCLWDVGSADEVGQLFQSPYHRMRQICTADSK